MKFAFIASIVICLGSLAGSIANPVALQQEDERAQELQKIKQVVRREFMRGKLVANQQIVEGLSINDFDMIAQGADGVTQLVKGEHWFVVDTPEYRQHSQDMAKASQRLKQAAVSKNIEATALRYFELTMKCIDCHQYYMKAF